MDKLKHLAFDYLTRVGLSEQTAELITKEIKDEPAKVEKQQYIELKKYNLNRFYKVNSVHNANWYKSYIKPIVKKHYYNQSFYYKSKNFTNALNELKEREIKYSNRQIDEDEFKSIDQCVVDSITSKPRYMKHNILLMWLSSLGFESLNSSVEIEGLENIIDKCKITESCVNILGGNDKILDEKNEVAIFRYINARLNEVLGSLLLLLGRR